ncbi:hypothetical protein NNJEOMEG_00807 [Fundidesulfovibrio magnetotacticus]|uniref:SGNH hydrolase-type esterase domain-containing protein n=1 Tax=Fundidesulfovibrio magnetotacticus TaxID=2730080 RepID=A0A6V8LSA2_9BACT|nr:SGNH/GDSL hydrolase family protein [Fundidesulfovibrio magnetotacticus]GFK92979.1 hypothetical protein NNJEOMEG_00807 [Fundidesulfovibrio magnetotacticus]
MRPVWYGFYLLAFTALCFAGAEGVLRLTGRVPSGAAVPRYFAGVHGDLEPHLRVVDRTVPALPYRVTANNQGSRGLADYSSSKPEGVLRVLCLGDSFTYGYGVDDEHTYPELLRRELERRYPGQKFEVVNAGIPIFGILDAMDYYLTKGAALMPDVVVLQFFPNDIHDHTRDVLFREGLANDPVYTARGLLSRWFSWSRVYQAAANIGFLFRTGARAVSSPPQMTSGEHKTNPGLDPFRFKATDYEKARSENARDILGPASGQELARVWSAYRAALEGMRRFTEHFGARLVFLAVPDLMEVEGRLYAARQELAPAVNAMGLPAVDMLEPFRRSLFVRGVHPYLTPRDGHCSPEGNQLVALAVADRLRLAATPEGAPLLAVAPGDPMDAMARPQGARLAVAPGGAVKAEPGAALHVWAVSSRGLESMAEGSVAIDWLGAVQARQGELVLECAAQGPVGRVEVRLPARLERGAESALGVDFSLDGQAWEPLLRRTGEALERPEGYETFSVLDRRVREASASRFFLRVALAGKARLYTERSGSQGDGSRAFWVTAFPATP